MSAIVQVSHIQEPIAMKQIQIMPASFVRHLPTLAHHLPVITMDFVYLRITVTTLTVSVSQAMEVLSVQLRMMAVPHSFVGMEDGVETWPVASTVLVYQVMLEYFVKTGCLIIVAQVLVTQRIQWSVWTVGMNISVTANQAGLVITVMCPLMSVSPNPARTVEHV